MYRNCRMVSSLFAGIPKAYAVGQIPGGWLADRFGPKKVLLAIVSFWSLMTAMTARTSGLRSLFMVRFAFGLGEAGAFPTAARAMRSAASFRASRIASAGSQSP
jgi:MFS family permease